MSNVYYTVKTVLENEYIVQKSKFISHIRHVETEEEAQSWIGSISKDHSKANHNCFAYVIGETSHIQKASDNGEPSGTAGVPILEVLKKQHLRDTLVVVTRYFGGIKLGAGGLIRAYSTATSQGIEASGVVERVGVSVFQTTFDYALWGAIENALKKTAFILRGTSYTEAVTIEVAVREDDPIPFEPWIQNLCSGQATVHHLEDTYIEVDRKSEEQN